MSYKVVYTAKQFHDILIHIATELDTRYYSKFPYNLGYYWSDGHRTWDCWNLVKSII